jgi:hypothetical protein
VWVDDPERGTVLGLAASAWVDAGELPIMTLEQDFTWSFWAKQEGGQASPADAIIVGNRYDLVGPSDTDPPEWIKFTPNRVEFHMNNSGSGDIRYSDDDPADAIIPSNDEWMHHIVVKDGEQLAYYRDGVLANQAPILDPMFSTEPLPFGLGGQNGVETWQGYLSDVRLFDHALSSSEIAELSGTGGGGITGDYNNNGQVEQGDLDLVLLNWGQANVPEEWTNNLPEGNIDQAELDGVLLNWGNSGQVAATAGAVPEPGALLLGVVGAGVMLAVRDFRSRHWRR